MTMTEPRRLYLGVNVTPICNYDCPYCKPGLDVKHKGEGYGTSEQVLEGDELLRLIRVAHRLGISVFRFTGGEPLLREDLMYILRETRKLRDDIKLNLDTNGTILHRYLPSLREIGNLHLRISLDRIDRGDGTLPKYLTPHLYSNIVEASRHIPTRINMVVMQSNKDQIWKIIDFCLEHKLDLKLLDLNYDILDEAYWQREFFGLSQIVPKLRELAEEEMPYNVDGGYGILMTAFSIGKIRVIVRDSAAGAHFPPICRRCLIFPCQEGFYNPLLTCDGTLHPPGCLFKPLMENLAYQSDKYVEAAFVRLLRHFSECAKENIPFRRLREYLERGGPLATPPTARYASGVMRRRVLSHYYPPSSRKDSRIPS